MNFHVEPAIVRYWHGRLPLEAKLARLMPKLPVNVAPWVTSCNWAKCRRSVAYYCSAVNSKKNANHTQPNWGTVTLDN